MDYRPKWKILAENIGENIRDSEVSNNFLNTKNIIHKNIKIDNLNLLEFNTSTQRKSLLREWKNQLQIGRKYLQTHIW